MRSALVFDLTANTSLCSPQQAGKAALRLTAGRTSYRVVAGLQENQDMTDRLTEIEIKIAHVEDSIAQLSDVLYEQRGLLDQLQQGLNQLREKVAVDGGGGGSTDTQDEKPPHY
jgi:SlyX protein